MSAHVVVLGGGVGGSTVATVLRKLLPAQHRITLVERSARFLLGASLLRVIVGERRPEEITRPVAALARRGIEVVEGDIDRIDPARRHVVVGNRELAADYLVVALGADLDASGVPGLADAGHSFYTLEGAIGLREALDRFEGERLVVLTAAPAYKCPAAPYEAALLVEWRLRQRGIRENVTVDLYAAEPAPMGVAGPKVSAGVRDLLAAKGIAYHPEHAIVRAGAAPAALRKRRRGVVRPPGVRRPASCAACRARSGAHRRERMDPGRPRDAPHPVRSGLGDRRRHRHPAEDGEAAPEGGHVRGG